MSYILDALKKAEEKRQQDRAGSTLHGTPHLPPANKKERSSGFIWFIALLVGAITAPWVYFHMGDDPIVRPVADLPVTGNNVRVEEKKQREMASPADLPADTTEESPEPQVAEEVNDLPQDVDEQSVPLLRPDRTKIVQRPAADNTIRDVLEPNPIIPEETRLAEARPQLPPPRKELENIPFLEELSPEVQQSVPEFKLAGHVYSGDPQLRMILINNTILREKDTVEKGYILEEITPDGVVIRSQDLRFRMLTD